MNNKPLIRASHGVMAHYRSWLVVVLLLGGAGPSLSSENPASDPAGAKGATPAVETKLAPPKPSADKALEPADKNEYAGEIYKIGLGWHPAAMQDFTRDKFGLVNWVATLSENKIDPKGSIDPKAQEIPPFDLNIVMPAKTGLIEGAYFPHKTHTTWLNCESCHTRIFIPQAGANDLTMSRIVTGQACGVCHGKVAFPLNDCDRCHVPQQVPATATATAKK